MSCGLGLQVFYDLSRSLSSKRSISNSLKSNRSQSHSFVCENIAQGRSGTSRYFNGSFLGCCQKSDMFHTLVWSLWPQHSFAARLLILYLVGDILQFQGVMSESSSACPFEESVELLSCLLWNRLKQKHFWPRRLCCNFHENAYFISLKYLSIMMGLIWYSVGNKTTSLYYTFICILLSQMIVKTCLI